MRVPVLVLIIQLWLGVQCDKNLIARAVSEMLVKFYAKFNPRVDVLCFNCRSFEAADLIDKLLKQPRSEKTPLKVVQAGYRTPWNFRLNSSTFLIFDNFKDYSFYHNVANWKPFRGTNELYHLVYIKPNKNKQLKTEIHHALHPNIGFLLDNHSKVDLVTFMYFSKDICKRHQSTINTFSKTDQKWENENFFPQKFSDVHGCSLNYTFRWRKREFTIIKGSEGKQFEGSTYELHKAIAEKLNIDAHYYMLYWNENNQDWDYAKHPSSTNLDVGYSLIYHSNVVQLETLDYTECGFIIPPGHPLTQFEKMFLMFEPDVWLWLCATLSLGLLAIQLLSFTSRKLQDIIFGEGVNTPTVNFFAIICGIGQTVLPRTNFARFILILYIFFCLIFRTCHQSMLYSLLQADLTHPELQTIDEATEKGFTFIFTEADISRFKEADFFSR